jgi:hypothetical protein
MKPRGGSGAPQEKYHSAEMYKPMVETLELIEQELHCKFEKALKTVHYLACWDCETYFDLLAEERLRGKSTRTLSKLQVFLIGCASNVEGYDKCKLFWLNQDNPTDYVKDFVNYLEEISGVQSSLLRIQMEPVYKQIEKRHIQAQICGNNHGVELAVSLKIKLNKFIKRMPCLAFNMSKFDARVLREVLLPVLFKKYGFRNIETSLKNGQYMRIITPAFAMLDMLNYLPGGKTSYDSWILSVLNKKLKQSLPYQWITSLDKLDEPRLPPLNQWFSNLKGHNVLEVNHLSYTAYIEKGVSPEQALSNLGLTDTPKPGQETLDDLQTLFDKKGFRTFKEWVGFYMEGDILPFVKASEITSRKFFDNYNVQLYREHTSIPSVGLVEAFHYLKDVDIFVPSENTYKLLKEKTCGGQSIIFQMEALKDITKIREYEFGPDARTCKSVFSLE